MTKYEGSKAPKTMEDEIAILKLAMETLNLLMIDVGFIGKPVKREYPASEYLLAGLGQRMTQLRSKNYYKVWEIVNEDFPETVGECYSRLNKSVFSAINKDLFPNR